MSISTESATREEKANALGQQFRAAVSGKPVEVVLATSERIIARVTDGIYREPWAAFRELCANAYDADAHRVVIETGAPSFDQITVRDDGLGMSPETLAYVVENIGGSSKRTFLGSHLHTADAANPDLSPGQRPLIGKIGIGLFAVAQLTQHFQIITKAKGEKVRTWATVILKTHHEDQLKKDIENGAKFEAGRATITSEEVPESELDAHGTTIVLHQLRPEIRRFLQSIPRWLAERERGPTGEQMRQPPVYHIGRLPDPARSFTAIEAHLPWKDNDTPIAKFRSLVKAASENSQQSNKSATLEHLDEYLQAIWKLSLALPLPYIDAHPFDIDGSANLITLELPSTGSRAESLKLEATETLRQHLSLTAGSPDPIGGFEIMFDGIELRRPIHLPNELRSKSRLRAPIIMAASERAEFPENALDRAGGPLRFEAYLYWNSKIVPKDTQGVIVRVREASGTLFDPKFLNYQISEQSRLRQITAEIFVTEGLDGAINIDRESFNYSHPHYLYIQRWLHRALRLLINRLKLLAGEDLDKEKAQKEATVAEAVVREAVAIWKEQRGEDYDVGEAAASNSAPETIADLTLEWLVTPSPNDVNLSNGLGIVLEAYGVLSDLNPSDRAKLINDLVRVVRAQQ